MCSMNIKEELTKSPVDGNAALAKDLQASAVYGAGFILPGRLGAEIHNMTLRYCIIIITTHPPMSQ